MPKYWFDHVHSINADPLRIAEFYERMFCAERISVETPPGLGLLVTLKLGDFIIKFMQPRTQALGSTSGLEHIALRTDNIEVAVAELDQAGAKIVRRIIEENTGGIKFKSAFIAIDNNLIELQEMEK
jgi:predicted enzyme related to lactoylglutathione lyase